MISWYLSVTELEAKLPQYIFCLKRRASKLSFTMKNDGNDREMILMSLACTLPDEEFTEMDQVMRNENLKQDKMIV
jgi:hypothetical protein